MTLYTIDDLHFSVNDIHEQWDMGKIHYDDAQKLLVKCCEAFIKNANQSDRETKCTQ